MTMHDKDFGDDRAGLEQLFAAAAENRAPPAALSARVLADADRLQPRAAKRPERRARPFWASVLGGWQGLGGLVAATCAGFWIGVSPPSGLPDPAALVIGSQLDADFEILTGLSAFGWDVEEG